MSRETCPRSGFVYVLTNPAMPGIVKIGRTKRSVDARAEELWTTGVPAPFDVYCEVKFPDCLLAEAIAHREFKEFRFSKSREFFSADPEQVLGFLKSELKRQLSELVSEFENVEIFLDDTPILSTARSVGDELDGIVASEVRIAARKARVPEKIIQHFFAYFPWEDAREWIIDQHLRIRKTSQFCGENPYWFKDKNGEYQRRPGPEDTVQ